VKDLILAGKQPTLPREIEESNRTVIKGIVHAMKKVFTFNPEVRPSARKIANFPSARKIANFLVDMYNKMEGEAQW
jgi:hypothetical protein